MLVHACTFDANNPPNQGLGLIQCFKDICSTTFALKTHRAWTATVQEPGWGAIV